MVPLGVLDAGVVLPGVIEADETRARLTALIEAKALGVVLRHGQQGEHGAASASGCPPPREMSMSPRTATPFRV